MDESGFSLTPLIGKTWAKVGQTPILRHCFNWPKLSVISAVGTNPHIYSKLFPNKTIKTEQIILFLKHLMRHIDGKIFLIWDNINPHKSGGTKQFVRENSSRIEMFNLPPYAPELNADEGVWNYIKFRRLKNYCPKNSKELQESVRKSFSFIRKRPDLIKSFFKQTPLNFRHFVN